TTDGCDLLLRIAETLPARAGVVRTEELVLLAVARSAVRAIARQRPDDLQVRGLNGDDGLGLERGRPRRAAVVGDEDVAAVGAVVDATGAVRRDPAEARRRQPDRTDASLIQRAPGLAAVGRAPQLAAAERGTALIADHDPGVRGVHRLQRMDHLPAATSDRHREHFAPAQAAVVGAQHHAAARRRGRRLLTAD